MSKEKFVEELRNLVYSAWVAGEPWNQYGLSWDKDELHILVDDKVYVMKIEEFSYEDLVKQYGDKPEAEPVKQQDRAEPGLEQD